MNGVGDTDQPAFTRICYINLSV